jgi:hypothetical protein
MLLESLTDRDYIVIQLILRAKDLKPEYRYLNIRLQLERQRLWNWSEVSGLLAFLGGQEDALDSSLIGINRHLILEVVIHIQTLVIEFVKVKGRYHVLASSSENSGITTSLKGGDPKRESANLLIAAQERRLIDSSENDFIEESNLFKRFPKAKERVKTFLKGLEVTQELPKRLRWAAWYQEKFKGLLDRLKELNDCLIDLMDNSVRMQILSMTRETNINFMGLCNKVDDLGQLVVALKQSNESQRSFHIDPRFSIAQAPVYLHQQEEANKELLDLCQFKTILQTIEPESSNASAISRLDLSSNEIEISEPRFKHNRNQRAQVYSSEGARSLARYQGQTVWIEWKEYQPLSFTTNEPDPRILKRVQNLAALLQIEPKPVAFRVPHCLGYFDQMAASRALLASRPASEQELEIDTEPEQDENFRFGLIFTNPPHVPRTSIPLSLFDLLSSASRPRPSLTSRLALGTALTNCVYYLHSVNWLHKGLRSHNIIFFPDELGDVDYVSPYLCGFDYARPSRREELTETLPSNPEFDIYKHPECQPASGEGYKKSYDIYSLGVILTEIARWCTVVDILDPAGKRKIVPSSVRPKLTSSGNVEAVAEMAGSLFAGCVRCCLEGGEALGLEEGEDEADEVVSATLNKEFYERVVKRLEHIRC